MSGARSGCVPEPRDQRAHEQRLHHRHLEVWRHLEAAQLQQPEPAARAVWAVQLVDAELGAVGVAGDVGQQVPQRAIGHPRLGRPGTAGQPGDLGERDLQLVERLGSALVDPRRLRCGADEPAGEQVRQRRMTLPVGQHRDQQVGPAQQRRIGGRDATERDVVAAAGSAVGAVDVERLGATTGPAAPRRTASGAGRVCSAKVAVGATLTSITPGVGRDGHRRAAADPTAGRSPRSPPGSRPWPPRPRHGAIRSTKCSSSSLGGRNTCSSPSRISATRARWSVPSVVL